MTACGFKHLFLPLFRLILTRILGSKIKNTYHHPHQHTTPHPTSSSWSTSSSSPAVKFPRFDVSRIMNSVPHVRPYFLGGITVSAAAALTVVAMPFSVDVWCLQMGFGWRCLFVCFQFRSFGMTGRFSCLFATFALVVDFSFLAILSSSCCVVAFVCL